MNGFQTFDLGDALNKGTTNAYNTLRFQGGIQDLQDKAVARKTKQRTLELSGQATAGDPQALQQLAQINPQVAAQIQNFNATAKEESRKERAATQLQLGRTAEASTDAASWDQNMQALADKTGDQGAARLVGHFDKRDQVITMAGLTAKATWGNIQDLPELGAGFKGIKSSTGDVKVLDKPTKASESGAGGGDTALKNPVYNTVAKSIARWFPDSALYDLNGNFIGFKQKDTRVAQINPAFSKVERMLADNPHMVVDEAVDKVLGGMGLIPNNQAAPGGGQASPATDTLPPDAASQLQDGHITTFGNGQRWMLQNGQPVRVP